MKKWICIISVLALLVSLTACGQKNGDASQPEEGGLTLLATTYPVYLLASAVADGVEGVTVERLNTGEVSCLHDYTLSVGDMKLIEGADILAINGVGLEDFMGDALATAQGAVIDCSQGIELLESLGHSHSDGDEEDDHSGHYDPHIWMDPENAIAMAGNLCRGLSEADPDHAQTYSDNLASVTSLVESWDSSMNDTIQEAEQNGGVSISGLITFHDGFQYFAKAFDLPLLAAIEEEEGSEASAQVINETVSLVKEKQIPVIFTEVNGSDATAQAIARETGCAVSQLTMLMDGPNDGELANYLDGLSANIKAIVNGFAGEEVVS